MPFVGDFVRYASLVLYTGDTLTDFPRAFPPNYVNVAGVHFKDSTKELPANIKDFLKSNDSNVISNDEFIYISLGSLVVSSNLLDNIKQVFFETVKNFLYLKFLWKLNGDFPESIPQNLLLRKWFPQMDLLAHPKIRGFITQTGRPSTLEAMYNGVPLISFPVLGDQDFNANRLAEIGASIKLEIGTVTVEQLTEAINRTAYDPLVKARMNKYQRIFRDRPMSPVDTAVWWTEYALRTDDMSHLRPAGADQYWFVRRQVDVWAFLSISLFLAITCVLLIIRKVSFKAFSVNEKIKTA